MTLLRKLPTIFALILLLNTLVFSGAIILDFHTKSGSDKVVLKWGTQNELNLKGFDVERARGDIAGIYVKIGFVEAISGVQGKKNYTFEDGQIFKDLASVFHYRLKILDDDGASSYSKVVTVTPTISSVRRTWGSIKAMFR